MRKILPRKEVTNFTTLSRLVFNAASTQPPQQIKAVMHREARKGNRLRPKNGDHDWLLVILLEILETLFGVGLHGFRAGLPASGTNFAEFIGEFECLNETQRFVHRSANGQVVDGNLAQILVVINDEKSAESDTLVLFQYAVSLGDVASLVGQQRDLHAPQSSLFPRRVDPSEMAKVRISRCCHDLASDLAELLRSVRKCDNLRGTDKGEVQRVEE